MKIFSCKLLFTIIALAQISVFAQADELKSLYEKRHYFDLRDAAAMRSKDNSDEILFYRGVVANRFNDLKESVSLLQKYVKKADKNSAHLADAYETLADSYTKTHEYGKAADTYKFLIDNFKGKLEADRIKGFENVFGLWNALRDVPPQTVDFNGDSTIQGTRDKAKLLNVPIEINAQKMDFVFDTGANISTISASTAAKLNLKIIESDVSVGSSTDKKVKSKLAVAPAMRLGNATVHNVVFLVLDDKSLHFPQIDYQIHGIVGFPVMETLGEISITRDDKIFIKAKKSESKAEPNLCLEGLLPLVAATYKNERLIFSFDTGAVSTDFYPLFFKANEAEIMKNSTAQKIKTGGAGGFMEVLAHSAKDLDLTVGGKTARFAKARILTEQTNENSKYFYGNLGQDLIKQFEKMTLDFRAMRIFFE